MRSWFLAICLALSLVGTSMAAPRRGGASGPFVFKTTINGNQANVTVTFLTAVTSAEVDVWGTDGLTVNGPATLLSDATVAAGETRSFTVTFTPAKGACFLGMRASGQSRGHRVVGVSSALVGTPAPAPPTQNRNGQRVELRGAH